MRVEHLDLGVEFGLDLGQLDLGLGLEFLVDRIGLGLLLLDLSTMRDGKLIRLRLGLQRKDPRIWRRRWRRRRRTPGPVVPSAEWR